MSGPVNNIVTFRIIDISGNLTRVALTLKSAFAMTCGLKPNVNHAICSCREFDKLVPDVTRTDLLSSVGTLEFWYSSSPGDQEEGGTPKKADVEIQQMSIIDVEGGEIGILAGEETERFIDYTLYLADFRDQFTSPRGGRLEHSIINASQTPPADDSGGDTATPSSGDAGGNDPQGGAGDNPDDAGDDSEKSMSDLIGMCLEAMGVGADVPAAVDNVDPPKDLKWFGNHAPTELQKLLERCSHVFVPHLDGSATIEPIGGKGDGSDAPQLQDDLALPELQLPGIDRRGKICVITSYPTAVINTMEILGPSSSTWEYVAQDSDKTWKPLDQLACCKNPAAFITGGFQLAGMKTDDIVRLKDQLYYYIRLAPSFRDADLQPILHRVIEGDGTTSELVVSARIATNLPGAGVQNAADFIGVSVDHKRHGPADQGNILRCVQRLGKVSTGGTDLNKNFTPLADGDLKVRFSAEEQKKNDGGDWVPEYFQVGYRREVTGIVKLTDDETKNALDSKDKDVFIISRPELQLIRLDGQDQNRDALESAAQPEADKYLRNSGQTIRQIRAKGFYPIEPSGLVAEITLDQANLITTAKLNNWWQPAAGLVDAATHKDMEAGEAYPHEAQMAPVRAALGNAGHTLPVVTMTPAPTPADVQASFPISVRRVVWQQIDDAGTWGADFVRFHQVIPGGG